MDKKTLDFVDETVYKFLDSHVDIMPHRLGKLIALYYTDARIRKKYSRFIGLEMGEGTFANLGMKVVPNDNKICVHIGRNVSIAPNVTFVCASDPNNGVEIRKLDYICEKLICYQDIIIEDDVWIGAGVTIFPGVKVGKCSVIGAGSIVMEDVEPYTIYAGTPARKIRNIRE